MKSAVFALHDDRRGRSIATGIAVLTLATAAGVALSQVAGPTEARGASTKALDSIDLSAEIDGLSGRQLRARLVTIEPGGHTAAHSHTDRPTLEYVVQGDAIEVRNGVEIPHKAGDVTANTREVSSHWWKNAGSVPVILLPVDVYKP